jgi:hypothetical protein
MSLFFVFGALMSGLTAFLLLVPGSPIEPLWRFNSKAREGFAGMGFWGPLLMTLVCLACMTATIGLWRCTRWGLWTAVCILAINLIGDTSNTVVTGDLRALIGLPIGGLMIWYLMKQRRLFTNSL